MKILVTGSAGFIGCHLVKKLLERGEEVIGLDNINDYYDVSLKYGRLKEIGISRDEIVWGKLSSSNLYKNFHFIQEDLGNKEFVVSLFSQQNFDVVVNLAAQAGVRYSITNPDVYIKSNIIGFYNILEACRSYPVKHLIYSSSSSVYGSNEKMPFSVDDTVDHPISLYAASKKTNELMAHTYSHLFKIPTTGLRFFTVYGPWGRPDMALFLFTKKIIEGDSIPVFNYGKLERDFTYIDDIIEGILLVLGNSSSANENAQSFFSKEVPYRLYNIGNSKPVKLLDFIEALEEALDKEAIKQMLPMQPGDVSSTWADVEGLKKDFGYDPKTDIKQGVKEFVKWYKDFFMVP